MLHLSALSNLVLTILVLAVNYQTYAAPTHHLTIGVQGKTPTLIVTSSEIGFTPPQTMASNKQSSKPEYTRKYVKNLDTGNKAIKAKLQKDQQLFNKKDKFEHFSKHSTRKTLSEENSFKLAKIGNQSNLNVNQTAILIENSIVLRDPESTTLKFEASEMTTILPVTHTATEQTFVPLTNLPAKQITEIPLILSTTPRIITTQPAVMSSTFAPQATTADTVSSPVAISNDDNLNIFSDMPTTLNLKDFEDITATNINYNDNTNTVTTPAGVTEQTTTETELNDVVVQTQKTAQNLPDKSVIKMKMDNDSDRHTQVFIATTENRNLLLTTTQRNAFATPSAVTVTPFPTLRSLITGKVGAPTTPQSLSLSLTMTMATTANIADDSSNNDKNEQHQSATTVHLDKSISGSTEEIKNEENGDEKNENLAKNESQNVDAVSEHEQDYIYITTEGQQTDGKLKITEYPVQQKIGQTPYDSVFKETTTNNYLKNQMQTEPLTTTKTMFEIKPTLTTEMQKKPFSTFTTQPKYQTVTTPTTTLIESPGKKLHDETATTEKILKLIDLEKQVLKTNGELRQSSLLMAGQHDNGHDGLKNIKKKQLIDKHYVEALLHNKQDLYTKALVENEKYLTHRVHGAETNASSIPKNSQPFAVTNKTMLVPMKHGYLGPILMEEKTFHVIHHTDNNNKNNNSNTMTDRNHHADDIENQLRRGHFVELKVKQEVTQDKSFKDALQNKDMKTSSREEREMLEMQSDQPVVVDVANNQNEGEKTFSLKKVSQKSYTNRSKTTDKHKLVINNKLMSNSRHDVLYQGIRNEYENTKNYTNWTSTESTTTAKPQVPEASTNNLLRISLKHPSTSLQTSDTAKLHNKSTTVLSTTVFQTIDSVATKTPMVQADTLFTAETKETTSPKENGKQKTESKISDIQIEVYDSTVDSIVASTNFRDIESKQHQNLRTENDENYLGRTTKPPVASIQQERFTQYVIDRTETSTQEPINYNTIRVASGKPEPAAIEIHINVSESFGNESEDVDFSYPQTGNNHNSRKLAEVESYDESKGNENIKLKIQSNSNGKELENDEILVVEIIDAENDTTNAPLKGTIKNTDELFVSEVKNIYTTPPPPPPPPPYQTNFERDSDTIFYISNTEVKVGESPPITNNKNDNEERKLRLESQFFPANYMASTHPSPNNNAEDLHPTHHLYEEDIILSPSHNQADSLKIYRNNNEPSPPLDVTYVGESIIEVEQSPGSVITTTYAPDQQRVVATPQPDVIIQPAILPEISIGVPVIGELPPQIELKEIDFMPNEAQLHRSGIYDDNDNDNDNSNSNNDIDENTINGSSNNNHDIDIVNGNSNNNQRVDESSIQYGGDLIDESADGGFDGVEGSYPFGNPAVVGKSPSYSYSSAFLTKLRKEQKQQQQQQQQHEQQKPNHVADYAHLYINYGVNNMRKDELSADVKDPEEMSLNVNNNNNKNGGTGNTNVPNNEQNTMSVRDFLRKTSMSNNYTMPFINGNITQSERMSNATAFSVMEDVNDLEDKNTEDIVNLISLAIGLFIVILPVVVTCSMFWALRYLYKKYHSNLMDNGGYTDQTEIKGPLSENGVEKGEEFNHEPSFSPSTNSYKDTIENCQYTSNKPSTTDNNMKFSSQKFNSQLEILPTNTNTTAIPYSSSTIMSKKNESLKLSLTLSSSPMACKQAKPSPSSSSPLLVVTTTTSEYRNTVLPGDVVSEFDDDDDDVEISGPNGSITKMTLENNLLIVETEERNDMSRVARETKMDYNKKGVFVVEVARGIDSKTIPESPVTEGNEKMLSMFDTTQNNGGLCYKMTNEKNCMNNEKVQIHSPPSENPEEGPRSLHQIEEVEEPINSPHLNDNNNDGISDSVYKAKTGLSQSDLSSTSSNDSNKGYCYGNQALYVSEQKDYSAARPNGNVALKCDIKDIKDDDHNPGNDEYLKNSPDKREELTKNKENIVESYEKSDERESRTSSGESPEQKQSDKVQEKTENDFITENSLRIQDIKEDGSETSATMDELENSSNEIQCNLLTINKLPTEISKQNQINCIPVQIEVHITPAQDDYPTKDTILSFNKPTVTEDFPVLKETQQAVEDSQAAITSVEADCIRQEPEVINNNVTANTIDNQKQLRANKGTQDDDVSAINVEPLLENRCEILNTVGLDNLKGVEENTPLETAENNKIQLEDIKNVLETNGNLEKKEPDTEKYHDDTVMENGSAQIEDRQIIEKVHGLNLNGALLTTECSQRTTQMELLTNGSSNLLDEKKQQQQLANGHFELECNGNATHDTENGYDSISSLPEPPPTTDEQPNNDDQQLDSLPPPPPPEIFNLKTLPPPPFTNGNPESLQSEESGNFYNTLPPPPPTTLEVKVIEETRTATNGKVHASPLTPPASPPAHFTNNLHAGLCSHPIAVDVNGS